MAAERGPHHADDTTGKDVILIEFVAEMVPHDTPEFQEHAREAAMRPLPDYLKDQSKNAPKPPSGKLMEQDQ